MANLIMANLNSPTLCLNMIVKNESRIITRLLESVVTLIDSYCICDTGSTDNTIEIIQTFFKSRNIPGRIVAEPFRDFGYNRTYALKSCETMDISLADYILLLDADMVFWKNPQVSAKEFKQKLNGLDIVNIFQGTDAFLYKNVRIVKNNRGFSYWGVTHEYVQSPANTISAQFDRELCFIKDIGDGGCKSDKFLRDIRLLTRGLEEIPNNDRYTFYLANSYRDAGQYEKSIETFKKRIALGGWIEEVWHSYYSIGRCYKFLNDMPNAIYYWLEAYNNYPIRIENLYEIIHYYRNASKNELAYTFFALANYQRNKMSSWDCLFLQKDIYDYKIDYELSIIGYYCNRDNHDLTKTCMKVLAYPGVDDGICKNVLSNYKFYTKQLKDLAIPMLEQNTLVLQSIGKELSVQLNRFVSSTPTLCYIEDDEYTIMICVRYVNYKIDEAGKYINQNNIETKNVVAKINIMSDWTKISEYILDYDRKYDNVYIGLEDVRLLTMDNKLPIYYTANRGLIDSHMTVEYGVVCEQCEQGEPGIETTIPGVHLTKPGQNRIEKNWSIFDSNNTIKCIYKWSPLTVGDIQETQFITITEIQTPTFFKHMRGSTPGVVMGDEVWFINHIVSYEDRRYYYHIVVVLDRTTYALKRYTPLWTFERSKVEYTLGFIYMAKSNQFLIGYSIMDRETKYMMISKQVFDDMMI